MKVIVGVLLLVASASAGLIVNAPVAHVAAVSTGTSTQSRTQDAAGNYAFSYNEQHATGGSSRSEAGAPGVATGSYTLNVADGRQRTVNYQADALGFRAAIATNEPGTAAQPAASTAIASPHLPPQPVAPLAAPVVAAPVHADVVAAPVYAPAPVAVAHAAPVVHHAAPVVHHAAPVVHHAVVPAVSSYSTAINHGVVAHAHLAAPLVAHAAPVVHHAPLLAHGHLAAPLAHY